MRAKYFPVKIEGGKGGDRSSPIPTLKLFEKLLDIDRLWPARSFPMGFQTHYSFNPCRDRFLDPHRRWKKLSVFLVERLEDINQ